MDSTEFKQWWNEYASHFPDTATWVQANGGADLLRRWAWCFERIQLADALEVTRQMAKGDIPKPAAYEREDTPGIVTRAVSRIVNQRVEATKSEELRRSRPKAGKFPAGALFRRLLEKQKETGSLSAAVAELRREFATEDDGTLRSVDSYKCLLCYDSGLVTAWRPEAMRQAALEQPVQRLICQVGCSCEEGAPWRTPAVMKCGRTVKDHGEFDETRMVRFNDRVTMLEAVSELREWVANPPARGSREFHDWNDSF